MRQTYLGAVIEGGGTYGIYFPDVPGVITAGDTLTEPALMAREGLQLQVEGMAEFGEAAPPPTEFSIPDIERDWAATGHKLPLDERWHSLLAVTVDVPEPATVAIAVDTELIHAVDRIAADRRTFIAEATRRELARLEQAGDAAMSGKGELSERTGDKRYVKRNNDGTFKTSIEQRASPSQDDRRSAKAATRVDMKVLP